MVLGFALMGGLSKGRGVVRVVAQSAPSAVYACVCTVTYTGDVC